MRSATTAHSSRSPRNFGKITPRLTAPTWCPARPTRCSPDATDGGDSTCTTRSTAPMSMPSSRLEVATTAGSRPAFRSSSTSARCSRDDRPVVRPGDDDLLGRARLRRLCAITCAGGVSSRRCMPARSDASSFSRAVSRSARRRELANTIVERCCSTRSSTRSSTCGQMLARLPAPAAGPERSSVSSPRLLMSSIGTTTSRSNVLSIGGCTTVTGRPPARNVATSSTGRTVADRPMRWAGWSSSASSRSRVSARCAPRLVAHTACTSSTITVSTPRSDSRAAEVSSRNSDSGVVIRMSAGVRAKARRSSAGVSPERIATVTSGSGRCSRAAAWRMPASGERRLRSTSTASALSGLT